VNSTCRTPNSDANAQTPLRILLLTDSDEFAGTEQHMLDLADGLRSGGVEVSIACPNPSVLGPKGKAMEFRQVVIQKGRLLDRPAIAVLKQLLLAGEVDLIHAHNGRTALSAMLAVRRAGRGGCVLTHHFIQPHHSTVRGVKGLIAHHIHRWINRRIGAHIAISDAVRLAAIERGDVSDAAICTVLNGIADPAEAAVTSPQAIRQSLGIPPQAPLVVCLARLEPEKNVHDLVAAMPGVIKELPEIVCVIAGDGSQRGKLGVMVTQLGVADCVRMVGFCKEPAALMNAAELVVMPSAREPFGLVLVEAMALGKPVIAARAGGPLEIVVDGVTGSLVETSNADHLASEIVRLIRNPALRVSMGIEARQRFEKQFTKKRMAAETEGIYQSVFAF
jgi:glycosyltransferase involved in cell wall biosynthesis